ncbi:MAG: GMC family oxidoreductase [Bacteroidetes bacterium]|nr:GMC family oxidoreductase [Bacteroidota bacterium]
MPISKSTYFNIDAENKNTYDAIVIGSGISGGWAAKELCEKGLKTLVLERGRMVEHIKDYPTATKHPWELEHRGRVDAETLRKNPLISKAAGYGEDTKHFFIQDADHPYIQKKPFDWIRGYQVGGKSLTWGRACQRWSKYEFTAPERQGYGMNWPIGYDDIAPWYSHVEKFIGVCGTNDGLDSMPDGEFLPPFQFNCAEDHLSQTIRKKFNRHMVHARWAHLTQPTELHLHQGRGKCQARNLCMRGCPFGGYFSSVSSTLPWAERTGNLTIRPDSVVHSLIYDHAKGKVTGVRVIDSGTGSVHEYYSRILFLNASALNTNLVLLNSTSARFPDGLGNDHGFLGKYIAFHNYRAGAAGILDHFNDKYYTGRNPSEPIIANYRNLGKQEMDYVGGFTTFTGAYRQKGDLKVMEQKCGADLKEAAVLPGPWQIYMYMQGETIPKESNQVRLSKAENDRWGIPLLETEVDYDQNDERMIRDFTEQSQQMLSAAGCTEISVYDTGQAPGLDIHEMGGCRMGTRPENSMLNSWNQLHACKNVFVTDGACMTSTGNQSPSILYMALTARAANHAIEELNKGNL